MFDLKCKRKSCEFNKNCNCTSKEVKVCHDTSCSTFKPTHKTEPEEEKISQPPIRKNIKVDCKADCIFNKNNHCSANGITVQTCKDRTDPSCCTFH